jgi:hypothetical protein
LVRDLERRGREAEERRRSAAGAARRTHALDALEHAAADEHPLQVRRRDVVAECGHVYLAQLRDSEHGRREREADVRVGELASQPRLGRGHELVVVIARGRPRAGELAVRGHEAEVDGRERAVGLEAGLELLAVGEGGHVDQPGERIAERFAPSHPDTTGERLEAPVAHAQHDADDGVPSRIGHGFRLGV